LKLTLVGAKVQTVLTTRRWQRPKKVGGNKENERHRE
jgi:hypothetical protein